MGNPLVQSLTKKGKKAKEKTRQQGVSVARSEKEHNPGPFSPSSALEEFIKAPKKGLAQRDKGKKIALKKRSKKEIMKSLVNAGTSLTLVYNALDYGRLR